jgi:hypothetical protein
MEIQSEYEVRYYDIDYLRKIIYIN